MSTDLAKRASRRAILSAAAGGAAALAASSLARPFPVAAASNMQTETDNATTLPTGVSNGTADSGALFGVGTTGYGLRGVSSDASDPASHANNVGVVGIVGDPTLVDEDVMKGNSGVFGYAPTNESWFGTGVWGLSDDYGVYGSGGISGVWGDGGAFGVIGTASASGTIGVLASATVAGSRALLVDGRAEFTRSGKTSIAAGAASKTVSLSGCTSSTLVFAVLATNRSGRWVRAVVPSTGSFKIYLNTSVTKSTNVVWIAFTNPSNHGG